MGRSFGDMMAHLRSYNPWRRDRDTEDVQECRTTAGLLSEALLIDAFTGLQNQRALEEREQHRAVFLEIDIRGLWHINKAHGTPVGDWVIGQVVDRLWPRWPNAYHLFADKFIVEFDDEADAQQFATGLCTQLQALQFYRQTDTRRECILNGIGLWYGIGRDRKSAD